MYVLHRQLSQTAPRFGARQICTSCLEVEQKFVPVADFRRQMEMREAASHGTKYIWDRESISTVRDVYYDLHDQLCSEGIWVRHRTTGGLNHALATSHCWEAKVRIGGDYTSSEHKEIYGEENIRQLLSRRLPNVSLYNLNVLADLKTTRSEWKICPAQACDWEESTSLSLTLDAVVATTDRQEDTNHAPFKHMIGEVEITKSLMESSTSAESEHSNLADVEYMREEIQRFMLDNPFFFSAAEPVGKLEAYLIWRKQRSI